MTQSDAPPAYDAAAYLANLPVGQHQALSVSLTGDLESQQILVTLTPPNEPQGSEKAPGKRAPVDLCCVIDVSGSMDSDATLPADPSTGKPAERTGLSILDIVKHSVKTIVSTMNEDDRIAVVTFSDAAKVVIPMTQTTESGKKRVISTVEKLRTEGCTNLWDGLKSGMKLLCGEHDAPNPPSQSPPPSPGAPRTGQRTSRFTNLFGKWNSAASGGASDASPAASGDDPKADEKEALPSDTASNSITSGPRLSTLFLLTDGMPNVEPPRGHIPMLKAFLESHPDMRFSINTFGFGYSLDSQLLLKIAEIGGGGYGFIPDSGMVGTVFVHAMANTYATFATRCTLSIEVEEDVELEVLGDLKAQKSSWGAEIDVGDVQYGQTKDVVIKLSQFVAGSQPIVTATARYRPWTQDTSSDALTASASLTAAAVPAPGTPLPDLLYHQYRLSFVSKVIFLFSTGSKANISPEQIQPFRDLATQIKTSPSPHASALALSEDIEGQVILALENSSHFSRWGRHYLPSLARSHQRQQCGNFKDAGLQVYGSHSPLFNKARDEIDAMFDSLPPPKPSKPISSRNRASHGGSVATTTVTSMTSFNCRSGPCFAGECEVTLEDESVVPISTLKRGMRVKTPCGPRSVVVVVRTTIPSSIIDLCHLDDLKVTPWHPISYGSNARWTFPAELTELQPTICDAIYSVMLEADADTQAHAFWVSGVKCVTLGHGILKAQDDVRAHEFLGSYTRVLRSLAVLPGFDHPDGVVHCGGMVRGADGKVCAFMPQPSVQGGTSNELHPITQIQVSY